MLRFLTWTLLVATAVAAPVTVRHKEGLAHGFITLRDLDGKLLADGDWIQNAHGDRVTSRMIFRFKDGSLDDETTVFTQRGVFRFVSGHIIQKGPSFPHPIDMTLTPKSATVHYTEDGKEKSATETLKSDQDLANGILLMLLKNVPADTGELKLGLVVATPKPRLLTLAIHREGEDTFKTGGESRKAARFLVKPEIGGLTGVLADLFGKTPPDSHIWIFEGEAPAFVKSEAQMYPGGPIWRIELAGPQFEK